MTNTTAFEEVGTIAYHDGQDGQDDVVSDNTSRRFRRVNEDGTFLTITEYFYVKEGEEYEGEPKFYYENMTEAVNHSDIDDVGGSEITSDIEYSGSYFSYETIEEAEQAGINHLKKFDASNYY